MSSTKDQLSDKPARQFVASERTLSYVRGSAQKSLLLRNPLPWLIVCVLSSFFLLAYPFYVIRPFRYQGPRELAAALMVMRFRPFLAIAFVLAASTLLVFSWRQVPGIWRKVAISICALLVLILGALSRVNVYERMFHPLDHANFSAASQAKLEGDEEVIAVRVGRVARVYPIRSMSYHHIVNDVLGGLPIVATY